MKKTIAVILFLLVIAPTLFAQESLKEVVREYQNNNSELTFVIPNFMIKMGLAFGDMEEEDREVLKLIDNMKIIVCEKNFSRNDFAALDKGISTGKFAEIMTVYDGSDKIRMVANKKSDRKSEMLMLVESEDENVLMLFNFSGEPDYKKFLSLAGK